MRKFDDVEVYAGSKLVTTASRLETLGLLMESGATNPFLKELFADQGDCRRCREPTVLIFDDEEEETLTEAFRSLSFKTGSSLSIIQSKKSLINITYYSNH